MALALRSKIAPSAWIAEGWQAMVTALELLDAADKEASGGDDLD